MATASESPRANSVPQRQGPQPRLRDVAAAAGVSSASVSRVLNNPETVRPDLRRKVEAAMAELAFVPNWAARALASKKSRTVGIVVPTLGIAIFAKGVEALQKRLENSGHSLLIASAEYSVDKEMRQIRTLLGRKVDGLVLVGFDHDRKLAQLIAAARVPIVSTYSYSATAPLPSIGIDNFAAARRVVRHLLDLGHRDFGIITSPVIQNDRTRSRLEGALQGLAAAGIKLPPEHVIEVRYTIEDGRQGLRELLARGARPTALVCTTDVLAIGAILEAPLVGLRVPTDLSVTGFDDLELASHLSPSLTTIHVPAEEIGRGAADLLLAMMQGTVANSHIEKTAELILRSSTAPAPAR